MVSYAIVFAVALIVSLCLTPPVRAFARRCGIVDIPDGRRKLHPGAVPKLGGIAVFLSFYICLWAVEARTQSATLDAAAELAWAMFLPSLLILILGIADDRHSVKPWMKISAQLVAGLLVYYHLNIRVDTVAAPFGASPMLGWLSLPATLFWIVLITNAFNVVDGMDGLATGVAFIALTCMFLVSLEMGRPSIAVVAVALAGSVLGFLRYNFNPASIFLGDSGSLFLGFQLAVLSIAGSQKSSTAVAVAAPVFILALPIVETTTSTIRRFLTGKSILEADSGHIHHQLMRLGFTPRRAAGILYVGSGVFGLASLFMIQNDTTVGMIAVLFALVTWVAIQRLGYTEFAEINSALKRFMNQRRIIQNSIVSRRLADDLRVAPTVKEAWDLLRRAARQLGFSYIELQLASLKRGDEPEARRKYALRLSPLLSGPESETSFAVKLAGTHGRLGQVIFSRSVSAAPLHSELPLLISAVAQCLPVVLESQQGMSGMVNWREHTPSVSCTTPARVNPAKHGPQVAREATCDACGSPFLRRCHTRSTLDRLFKNLTARRLHRCSSCGWRGWKIPIARFEHEEHTAIARHGEPDLFALDVAVSRIRSATSPMQRDPGEMAFHGSRGSHARRAAQRAH